MWECRERTWQHTGETTAWRVCVCMCVWESEEQREMSLKWSRNLPLGANAGLFITSTITPENRATVWQKSLADPFWPTVAGYRKLRTFWSSLNGWLCVTSHMNVCYCVACTPQGWIQDIPRDHQRMFLSVAFDMNRLLLKSQVGFYAVKLNPCCIYSCNMLLSLLFSFFTQKSSKCKKSWLCSIKIWIYKQRNQKLEDTKQKWKKYGM